MSITNATGDDECVLFGVLIFPFSLMREYKSGPAGRWSLEEPFLANISKADQLSSDDGSSHLHYSRMLDARCSPSFKIYITLHTPHDLYSLPDLNLRSTIARPSTRRCIHHTDSVAPQCPTHDARQ